MQRKKRVQTLHVIYPPQLSVCGLKIKVHLQGVPRKKLEELRTDVLYV